MLTLYPKPNCGKLSMGDSQGPTIAGRESTSVRQVDGWSIPSSDAVPQSHHA